MKKTDNVKMNGQTDKQWSTKHYKKTKVRTTRTPLKTSGYKPDIKSRMIYILIPECRYLRIDCNFCLTHEEITSIRLYTPCNPRSGLRKGVYNLIVIISNKPNK